MTSSKEYLHFILEQLSALELMPAAICDLPYEGGCYEHLCPILTFGQWLSFLIHCTIFVRWIFY